MQVLKIAMRQYISKFLHSPATVAKSIKNADSAHDGRREHNVIDCGVHFLQEISVIYCLWYDTLYVIILLIFVFFFCWCIVLPVMKGEKKVFLSLNFEFNSRIIIFLYLFIFKRAIRMQLINIYFILLNN